MEQFYEAYKDAIGEEELRQSLFTKRLRIVYLVDFGAHLSPTTAFYILQGIETLSLRMERHTENAIAVAEFLAGHEAVKEVSYPALKASPYHALSLKYFPRGPGAILSIRLTGGLSAARRTLENVRIFDYMVNVGDAKSLIVHPVTSTHFGQPESEQRAAGVYEDTLRLSVGIEDVQDLIHDLDQALQGA
jgi:O-acetylhomoserine (thiol)-lyase